MQSAGMKTPETPGNQCQSQRAGFERTFGRIDGGLEETE